MTSRNRTQEHDAVANSDLILTKIAPPILNSNRLSRERLIHRLQEEGPHSVTTVVAPAGFGKTTVMSEWAARIHGAAAWFSLSENDNDLVRFWNYVTAALQRSLPNITDTSVRRIRLMRQPPFETLLTPLISELGAFRGPVTLFLDDFHEIGDPAVLTSFSAFLAHVPENVSVVIGSRVAPSIPLSRLRAASRLHEVRSRQLAFTRREAALLIHTLAPAQSTLEIDDLLWRRTDGWPAGLQIAAIALRDSSDPLKFAESFNGQHRHILDFLREEVLHGISPSVREFLVQTSVLDRLNADLCDAVTGKSTSNRILEDLVQADLFIVPLDDTRTWFRYHRVFQDVLRQCLAENPISTRLELHLRASKWFVERGYLEEAVEHAIQSENWQQVVNTIEPAAGRLLTTNRARVLQDWAYRLPKAALDYSPSLGVRLAIALSTSSLFTDYEPFLQPAERLAQATSDQKLLGEVLFARSFALLHANRLDEGLELAIQSEQCISDRDLMYRGITQRNQGLALVLKDRPLEAEPVLISAFSHSMVAGNLLTACLALSTRALARSRRGLIQEGLELVQEALILGETSLDRQVVLAAVTRARLLIDCLEFKNLDQIFADSDELCDRTGHRIMLPIYRIQEARYRWMLNDSDGTERILEQLRPLILSIGVPPYESSYDLVKARIDFAEGNWEALSAWTRSDLNLLGSTHQYDRLSLVVRASIWNAVNEANPNAAERHFDTLQDLGLLAKTQGRGADQIDALVAEATARYHLGQVETALGLIEEALTIARQGDCLRPFVEEGQRIVPLLKEARVRQIHMPVIDKILSVPRLKVDLLNAPSTTLSPRESEILKLLAHGYQNHEIAEHLILSENTIKTHLKNVYSKLGSKNRTEAVSKARELSLI